MINYDSSYIYKHAELMEQQARSIIAVAVVVGLLLGGIAGFVLGQMVASNADSALQFALMVGGGALSGLVGYFSGTAQAFKIRVQIHTLLCQIKIEENTR